MEDVMIMLHRGVDRQGDYGDHDPLASYSKPDYSAQISNDGTGEPCVAELRLSKTDDAEHKYEREALVISPVTLNEDGDLVFGVDTLMEAINMLRLHKARSEVRRSEGEPDAGTS